VATLALAKTAYRLGESINGVIELNRDFEGWASALKVRGVHNLKTQWNLNFR
jgi:hypothetical protein